MTPRYLLKSFGGGVLGVIVAAVVMETVTRRRDNRPADPWRTVGYQGWSIR